MSTSKPTFFAPAERKSAEEIEREGNFLSSVPLLGRLLDTVPIGMLVLDDCRQIVKANRTMAAIVGCPDPRSLAGARPGEAVGCIHANSADGGCGTSEFCRECGAVRAILAAQAGAPDIQECRIALNNGDSLDLQVHAIPFALEGGTFTLFCILDLSHEKRRQVLERIFFHDILNTAGGLYGVADLMSGALPQDDRSMRFVHAVFSLSKSIIEEIQAQKVLAAAENSDLPVHPQPLQSLALLEEVAEAYEHHEVAHDKKVLIEPTSLSCGFLCDHMLLKRVLGNLLKNALEASSAGEQVTLRCLEPEEPWTLAFEVHNPAFIPRNVQLQLFNRSFSTKGSGRGVGTYSIKLITEKYLGGQVTFCTSESEGTTFRVTLPTTEQKEAPRASAEELPETEATPGLHGVRVLLAEDNEINQQIAVELLTRAGAHVDVARDGRQAVDLASTRAYDVVLMDLRMPGMDGFEATAAIRAVPRLAGLPIVAMTAHDSPQETQRCLEQGMNAHVAKPLHPPTLLATVARYHRPALHPAGAQESIVAPNTETVTPLPPEVPEVEGLNATEGLLRVARNVPLYLRLLRQFASEQRQTPEYLVDLVAQEHHVPAMLLAHSLKGVAGNIGATQVHQAAARLEYALAHADETAEVKAALDDLTHILTHFVDALTVALAPAGSAALPVTEAVALDEERVREVLAELRGLLEEFEPSACDYLDSQRDLLGAWWPNDDFQAFADCVARYAFGEALPLLEAVMAR